ncbi:hypothetical protein DC53_11550 [Pseudoalteromonas fuliginea]|uniref:Uncharacterized protein n=1 Tax=Pseudoalteromonas fuliginea TaxID=1872678 RepID=A0ABD3Y820_9GAMM|nr:hypothetical protein DC53_11550 [Pseudoalteromonas fuliginea]
MFPTNSKCLNPFRQCEESDACKWVKNVVLNERVEISELGSVQGCESDAFMAFTLIIILCLKISEIEGLCDSKERPALVFFWLPSPMRYK